MPPLDAMLDGDGWPNSLWS